MLPTCRVGGAPVCGRVQPTSRVGGAPVCGMVLPTSRVGGTLAHAMVQSNPAWAGLQTVGWCGPHPAWAGLRPTGWCSPHPEWVFPAQFKPIQMLPYRHAHRVFPSESKSSQVGNEESSSQVGSVFVKIFWAFDKRLHRNSQMLGFSSGKISFLLVPCAPVLEPPWYVWL